MACTENRAGSGSSTLTGAMVSALHPLVAANVGFAITFGLFVVALLTLFFLTARWAIRHDRAGYAAWRNATAGRGRSDHHSDHDPDRLTHYRDRRGMGRASHSDP